MSLSNEPQRLSARGNVPRAPAVLEVLGAFRRLGDLDPAWWIAVLATSAAGIGCMCALQRMALNRAGWSAVIT